MQNWCAFHVEKLKALAVNDIGSLRHAIETQRQSNIHHAHARIVNGRAAAVSHIARVLKGDESKDDPPKQEMPAEIKGVTGSDETPGSPSKPSKASRTWLKGTKGGVLHARSDQEKEKKVQTTAAAFKMDKSTKVLGIVHEALETQNALKTFVVVELETRPVPSHRAASDDRVDEIHASVVALCDDVASKTGWEEWKQEPERTCKARTCKAVEIWEARRMQIEVRQQELDKHEEEYVEEQETAEIPDKANVMPTPSGPSNDPGSVMKRGMAPLAAVVRVQDIGGKDAMKQPIATSRSRAHRRTLNPTDFENGSTSRWTTRPSDGTPRPSLKPWRGDRNKPRTRPPRSKAVKRMTLTHSLDLVITQCYCQRQNLAQVTKVTTQHNTLAVVRRLLTIAATWKIPIDGPSSADFIEIMSGFHKVVYPTTTLNSRLNFLQGYLPGMMRPRSQNLYERVVEQYTALLTAIAHIAPVTRIVHNHVGTEITAPSNCVDKIYQRFMFHESLTFHNLFVRIEGYAGSAKTDWAKLWPGYLCKFMILPHALDTEIFEPFYNAAIALIAYMPAISHLRFSSLALTRRFIAHIAGNPHISRLTLERYEEIHSLLEIPINLRCLNNITYLGIGFHGDSDMVRHQWILMSTCPRVRQLFAYSVDLHQTFIDYPEEWASLHHIHDVKVLHIHGSTRMISWLAYWLTTAAAHRRVPGSLQKLKVHSSQGMFRSGLQRLIDVLAEHHPNLRVLVIEGLASVPLTLISAIHQQLPNLESLSLVRRASNRQQSNKLSEWDEVVYKYAQALEGHKSLRHLELNMHWPSAIISPSALDTLIDVVGDEPGNTQKDHALHAASVDGQTTEHAQHVYSDDYCYYSCEIERRDNNSFILVDERAHQPHERFESWNPPTGSTWE
ncbi:hypothetical protein AURDEDRAFT_119242 [Auricularia subglabra TFB-10046 SS5]|nr:hypothetical protein AURDEDRAFT_119242 [Auricularia subglabra TFB-10046 SS5]